MTRTTLKFLFLESFYGGSHARFADGLVAASSHDIDLLTMPGQYWKWRMLGAALYFAETAPDLSGYDGLIVSDLFNLADFLAVRGPDCPPVLVYFHENQITYPQPPGDKGAFQTGMINITTALAGRRLIFNSEFHRRHCRQNRGDISGHRPARGNTGKNVQNDRPAADHLEPSLVV
ncbi:MAG: DUF3524 domain-containing protein [Desulfosudaceae bacterium]